MTSNISLINASLGCDSFQARVNTNIKLKNLHTSKEFKNSIKIYLRDFNLQNYKLFFTPEFDEDKLVKDWINFAQQNKQNPIIFLKTNQENQASNLNVQSNENTISSVSEAENSSFFNISINKHPIKDLVQNELNNAIKNMQLENQNMMTEWDRKHQDIVDSMRKENQDLVNNMSKQLESYRKELFASQYIFQLAHFMFLFRWEVVNRINSNEGSSFQDWDDMTRRDRSENEKRKISFFITRAVNELGLNLDDWATLRRLTDHLNILKHTDIGLVKGRELNEKLKATSYSEYVNSFESLFKVFEINNFRC